MSRKENKKENESLIDLIICSLCLVVLVLMASSILIGCGAPEIGNSTNINTSSTVITGSYNTNQTKCDFVSTKQFDTEGNIQGCIFNQTCEGNVRTSDFIPFYDKDFNAKCVNPEEELPIDDGTGGAITDPNDIPNFNDDPVVTH